ncbi:MAG TPA: hypothetical protein VIN07_13450 [Flavipsychrobacter sp.]
MSAPFYKRIWQKPPIAFPWIAVGHVALLLYLVYDVLAGQIDGWLLIQPLYILCYTIAWLFVCDMKKWAGYAYTGLTTLNLMLHLALTSEIDRTYFVSMIFPADVLFTFFVLFYYKKLD